MKLNFSEIDNIIKKLFDTIEFTAEPKGLYDPLRYMIGIGGKRLRPRLCLLTYGLFNQEINEHILMPSTGLEVFHNFTLIHDDIMDKSPLRRGKETIWKKWDSDTAILSGDVMCIESYRRMAKAPLKVLDKVMELFSKTTAQVCEGQQLDKEFESKSEVPMQDYMQMIGLKTAVLLACAAKMGALIAGAKYEDCDKLYEYGYYMGLAFQVADDFLDIYGDEKVFGKPIGGDIVNNKKTWLTIRALEKADENLKNKLLEILNKKNIENLDKINKVKAIYEQLSVKEDAEKEILYLNNKAIEVASQVCEGQNLTLLENFACNLIGRKK